jgi:hypothetical protein
MSFLVLAALMTISFRVRRRRSDTRSEVMGRAAILGGWAGTVVGVSTGIRGIVHWSRPGIAMVAVALVTSFVIVFLITNAVALIAYGVTRRDERAGT